MMMMMMGERQEKRPYLLDDAAPVRVYPMAKLYRAKSSAVSASVPSQQADEVRLVMRAEFVRKISDERGRGGKVSVVLARGRRRNEREVGKRRKESGRTLH